MGCYTLERGSCGEMDDDWIDTLIVRLQVFS